ncbi:hypothetical protein PMS51_04740 [Bifidobacterium longum]|nr:hypothetical protein [Bifidobacterium longum]MDB6818968.1 hypothetical protein [Bifidobacterium longum]
MIQNVSSATPLEKVDYHLRDDGLADIRIRRNIRTVTHQAADGQPEYVEYTAVESYQVLPLMEQEVIDQADVLFEGDTTSSRPVLDRVSALEQATLDNAQLLADLMAGENGNMTDSTDADTGKTDGGDASDDGKNTADDSADNKNKE